MEFKGQGYCFYLNDNWRELTIEEREQFGITDKTLNYLVNIKEGKEFFVQFDGYSQIEDDVDQFYNICKTNMLKYGMKFLNEEEFIGVSMVSGQKIHARKSMCQLPNGIVQTSYFTRLSGKTPNGYMYGCLTTSVTADHDSFESALVSALTNWKYL